MQAVTIHTKTEFPLNPTHGEMYSIQHYVIMLVRDRWQVGGFLHQ